MTGLIMAAQLILGLSILVLLHEMGHFLAAKAFGIKVEKFYLFFDAWGIKLLKFKYKDTEYGKGWLPLGGYVKIAGMIDESMDKEQMKEEPKDWEFRSKPAWQRLIVMIGGVVVNLVLGVALFTMVILAFEKEYVPISVLDNGISPYNIGLEAGFKEGDKIISINNKKLVSFKDALSVSLVFGADVEVERDGEIVKFTIDDEFYNNYKESEDHALFEPSSGRFEVFQVMENRPAYEAGIETGDVILSINEDIEIINWPQFSNVIREHRNEEISLSILRNGDTLDKSLTVDSLGIGIMRNMNADFPTQKYGFGQAIYYGWSDAMEMLRLNITGLGKIFKGQEKATDSLQGPIGIAQIYGGVWDWHKFWYITGLLSLILAFMNILPIPALDGGHVIFLLIEIITRRKLSDRVMGNIQMIGMLILFALMFFVIGNDIFRLFK